MSYLIIILDYLFEKIFPVWYWAYGKDKPRIWAERALSGILLFTVVGVASFIPAVSIGSGIIETVVNSNGPVYALSQVQLELLGRYGGIDGNMIYLDDGSSIVPDTNQFILHPGECLSFGEGIWHVTVENSDPDVWLLLSHADGYGGRWIIERCHADIVIDSNTSPGPLQVSILWMISYVVQYFGAIAFAWLMLFLGLALLMEFVYSLFVRG